MGGGGRQLRPEPAAQELDAACWSPAARSGLCLITHPEHGRVAGELGRRWGNKRFEAPEQSGALVTAATHHDDGWYELDGRPSFNPEQARPAHFLELPLEVTVPPYGRGVDSVYARDRHAGALVSMHWAGLYDTRFGLHGGEPLRHPLAVEVVAEQDHRRVAALRERLGRSRPAERVRATDVVRV